MPGEKILVAEDEEDIRHICVRILSNQNYQVKAVESGLQAVKEANRASFDILLTDLKMPRLDGLGTIQAIKALQPEIVSVVMTGFGTMETAIKALQLGVDEFLLKPFTPDMLTGAVSKAVEKVRLRRENIRLRALVPLFELNKTFLSTIEEDELLLQVLKTAQRETRADGAALFLLSEDEEQLTSHIERNLDVEDVLGRDLALRLAQISRQVVVPWRHENGDLPPTCLKELAGADIHAAIVTPLPRQAGQLGALLVTRHTPNDPFGTSDDELLTIFCGQASIAIENARLFEEIQQAYEELKELDRLKSEFINIAAHELRTPLAILMGHASLLREELTGSMGQRMGVIVRNALRLRQLIDDMLNLRHLESGAVQLHWEPADLAEVIDIFIGDLAYLVHEKDQRITVSIAEGLPPVMIDFQRLHLVFSNLISNAIKFTPEGGNIHVRGWMEDGEVRIAVEDDGIGIPADETAKIFGRFYQVEDSLTRAHEGIGLGLAIVKSTVELWNGRVWVESQVGQGSTFTFTIPQDHASAEEAT
jgi:signal transduction histidine kinase